MNDLPELVLGNELAREVENIADTAAVTSHVIPNIAEASAASALSFDSLTVSEQQLVSDFKGKIDINDQNVVMQYGAQAQNKIAKFSDNILANVKTKDLGPAGKSLSDLVVEIKRYDAAGVEKKSGLLKWGQSTKRSFDKMMAGYDKAADNIDNITANLENHKRGLMKDIAMLDAMYENNFQYFKEITLYIIAGQERLAEFRDKDIPKQREIAAQSGGEMETQKLNDMVSMADRFEKKLHDLKLTRMISIQMAPQIRLLQNNDAILAEKIQSSITNAIPLWKNQMVIALGLANSQSALEAQKKVSDMTNELLVKNSEMLKQTTVNVAKASEESVVSIDAVRKTNENLISTINEVLDIQKKGAENRAAAESELTRLEGGLKTALFEASNRKL